MAHHSSRARSRRRLAAAAALLFAAPSWAQQTITITGRASSAAGLAGFGDVVAEKAPLSLLSLSASQLADLGVATLGNLTRSDPSIADAYNAEGYWAGVAMRGYTLDNRFNFRRDGLPINAETAIALENKERLEVLKGTSGIQAGTSAPGGLVNLVVKRPDGETRQGRLEWRQAGSLLAAVDVSQRLAEGRVGVRLNLAGERLDPLVRDSRGQRHLAALALDWSPRPSTLLQVEVEHSRQRQPSVAGFSLLGNSVPDAATIDRRLNLNHQPWSQPVVMAGTTASLRLQQQLMPAWTLTLHTMQQRLKSDDRTAFPFGVYDPQSYDCPAWCDRFAPDGTFSYWEYISDNERRTSTATQAQLSGRLNGAGVEHRIEAGVLLTRYRGRFADQVFDIAGTGRIDGSLTTPRSAGFVDANTNRDERSVEWFLRDAIQLGAKTHLWAGLRHSALDRESVRTSPDSNDSLRGTRFERDATTPWLALAHQWTRSTLVYASWGRGLETDVAPNRPRYSNAGQSLALQSRQIELGLKHSGTLGQAALTLFDIDRGTSADLGSCSSAGTCVRTLDGSARHRGIEAQWQHQLGRFSWQLGAMGLDAQRIGSQQPGVNGQRPVNVPRHTLRASTEWRAATAADIALLAQFSAEGDRLIVPGDTALRIPGWSRLDLGLRWRQQAAATALTWRIAVDNITDRRAWKESPNQFGHVYLYPLAPRTWRASLHAAF